MIGNNQVILLWYLSFSNQQKPFSASLVLKFFPPKVENKELLVLHAHSREGLETRNILTRERIRRYIRQARVGDVINYRQKSSQQKGNFMLIRNFCLLSVIT